MLSEQRHRAILEALEARGTVTVSELVERFAISEMTVRRDLGQLERQGLLRRVRGGAIGARGRSYEPAFLSRAGVHQEAKERIARAAAGLVQDGDSIILDIGTTTLELARQMGERQNLTVVTPSLRIAQLLAERAGTRIILTGGILRPGELSLIGRAAEESFQQFYVDKLFLGIAGVDLEAGLTDFVLEEALVKKAMLRSAKQIIVVTDASKFGQIAFAAVAPLSAVHCVVTDASLDSALAEELRARSVEVILA